MIKNFNQALNFVIKQHHSQYHVNGVPVWHHLFRVSNILNNLFLETTEGKGKKKEIIILAALGHDLLEDTKASQIEIKKVFGEAGLNLIMDLTNDWGDDNVIPYVKKVTSGSEEARLIKLADLLDNISSVTYNLPAFKKGWVDNYFLRVISPMKNSILKTKFAIYPKTSEQLKVRVRAAYDLLLLTKSKVL